MKKYLFLLLFLFSSLLFAETYRISDVDYKIDGCGWQIFSTTKSYALDLNVPVDKKKVFESREALDKYLKQYFQRLENTRAFERIVITPVFPDELQDTNEVVLKVYVKDSFHLLAVPYPKYDSNRGLDLKIKIKDSNFLGSLNALSTDVFFLISSDESDNKTNKIGFTFDYNHPFPIGDLNATWVNSDEFHYTFGANMPEWKFKTGLQLCLPFDKYSYTWAINQYYINNLDYATYNDSMYFVEEGQFTFNINLYKFQNNSTLSYTPYINALYNWDADGISEKNLDLYGTRLSIGHSISNSKIDWGNDLRKGYSLALSNVYTYNFGAESFIPTVSLTAEGFYPFHPTEWGNNGWEIFNHFGITSRMYAFYNFVEPQNFYLSSTGSTIGGYLRGIRDEQYYVDPMLGYLCRTNSAIVFNIDFPFQVIKTNFKVNFFNFNLQFVPFVDIALIQNKYKESNFNPKDGLYSAGLEVLVFPTKLKSMIIRGSCGLDLKRLLKKGNAMLDPNVSPWEITFGVGLFY